MHGSVHVLPTFQVVLCYASTMCMNDYMPVATNSWDDFANLDWRILGYTNLDRVGSQISKRDDNLRGVGILGISRVLIPQCGRPLDKLVNAAILTARKACMSLGSNKFHYCRNTPELCWWTDAYFYVIMSSISKVPAPFWSFRFSSLESS